MSSSDIHSIIPESEPFKPDGNAPIKGDLWFLRGCIRHCQQISRFFPLICKLQIGPHVDLEERCLSFFLNAFARGSDHLCSYGRSRANTSTMVAATLTTRSGRPLDFQREECIINFKSFLGLVLSVETRHPTKVPPFWSCLGCAEHNASLEAGTILGVGFTAKMEGFYAVLLPENEYMGFLSLHVIIGWIDHEVPFVGGRIPLSPNIQTPNGQETQQIAVSSHQSCILFPFSRSPHWKWYSTMPPPPSSPPS